MGDAGVSLGICGSIEQEIAELEPEEQADFLEGLGLAEPARNPFIRAAYAALNYMSFLTAGEDECRAWTVRKGTPARRAAGVIHSDLERGFIRAEVIGYEDLVECGSMARAKEQGLLRLEGKDLFVCHALAGRRVRIQRFDDKILVSYRHMHIREIDLKSARTTAVVRPANWPSV